MPIDAAELARAIALVRTGRGRLALRDHLARVDPALRRERNTEKLRLAQLQFMLRSLDTRRDPGPLQQRTAASAARLAALEAAVVAAVRKLL